MAMGGSHESNDTTQFVVQFLAVFNRCEPVYSGGVPPPVMTK